MRLQTEVEALAVTHPADGITEAAHHAEDAGFQFAYSDVFTLLPVKGVKPYTRHRFATPRRFTQTTRDGVFRHITS